MDIEHMTPGDKIEGFYLLQTAAQKQTANGRPFLTVTLADRPTPEALPGIIEALLQEGYSFLPISQLLLTCDYTIDHTGRQCPAEST